MKRIKNKTLRAAVAVAILLTAGFLLISAMHMDSISAFFTGVNDRDNVISVGDVELRIEEKGYEKTPEGHQNVAPENTIIKDPDVVNTGENTAFVFLQVLIPEAEIVTYSGSGETRNKADTKSLFALADVRGNSGVNDAWTQVDSESAEGDYKAYVYAYGSKSECTPLRAGETTSQPLFSYVRFAKAVEGQGLDNNIQKILIRGYAVQADNISSKNPESVWEYIAGRTKGEAKAFFTSAEEVTNEIDIGNSDISIVENAVFPDRLLPGTSVKKNISFRNEGKNICAVRARIDFSDPAMKEITEFVYNADDWKYDSSDGYYYYRKLLEPGQKTEWVYDHFKIKGTEADMKNFDILVYSESRDCNKISEIYSVW